MGTWVFEVTEFKSERLEVISEAVWRPSRPMRPPAFKLQFV